MSLYEATFIARQELAASDVEKLTETFNKIITDNGGKIVKTENWGLRNLAYVIKKNRKGHYVYQDIEAPYEALQEFERVIRLNEDILRLMIVRVEVHDEKESLILSGDSNDFKPRREFKDRRENKRENKEDAA